jgi:hypothetical protein
MLEVLPNFVRLLALDALLQCDDLRQILVKVRRAFPVLSQVICPDVAGQVASLLADLKHLVLLIVVHEVVISQLVDEEFQWAGRSQMNMVDCWLRHLVKAVVEITLEQRRQFLVVCARANCRIIF